MEQSPREPDALRDDEVVYRLAGRSSYIDKENDDRPFLPVAFLLDPDEAGLSVFRTEACSLAYAIGSIFKKVYGVNTLQAGGVRAVTVEGLSLDVVPTEDPKHPGKHAEITGLPHIEDDALRANRAAELLARLSQRAWRRGEPIPGEEQP